MSLNHILSQIAENKKFNPRFNSIVIDHGADLKNSGISNVSTINGIPFGGLVVKPESIVIYKPGSGPHVPLTNIYGTWSEIKNVINATSGAIEIFIDDSMGTPTIDSNTDFKNRCIIKGSQSVIKPTLLIDDGVVVDNLGAIQGIYLKGAFTTTNPLQYTSGYVLTLVGDARLVFTGPSTYPFINMTGSSLFTLFLGKSSTLDNSLSVLTPIIQLNDTSSLIVVTQTGSTTQNNTIYGAVGTGVLLITDASGNIPNLPNMMGSINTVLEDHSTLVYYNDTAPLIGVDNVQQAINLLKFASTINYNDTVLPAYGATDVQGALDAIKPLIGGAPAFCSVSGSGAYVVTVSNVPVTNITNAFTGGPDLAAGITTDAYGIIIPNGNYRISWSVAFSKNVNDQAYIGAMLTDLALVPGAVSGIVAYDNSLLTVFATASGETYLQNSSGNQYVQLYATSLGGNIDFTIYSWNISVQSI